MKSYVTQAFLVGAVVCLVVSALGVLRGMYAESLTLVLGALACSAIAIAFKEDQP